MVGDAQGGGSLTDGQAVQAERHSLNNQAIVIVGAQEAITIDGEALGWASDSPGSIQSRARLLRSQGLLGSLSNQ